MICRPAAPNSLQPSSANACCGVLDKLPDQKKKSTMLKTWKRRYFVADQGELRTFEAGVTDPATAAPVQMFQLSGGRVEDLGELMIGIDDGVRVGEKEKADSHRLRAREPIKSHFGSDVVNAKYNATLLGALWRAVTARFDS